MLPNVFFVRWTIIRVLGSPSHFRFPCLPPWSGWRGKEASNARGRRWYLLSLPPPLPCPLRPLSPGPPLPKKNSVLFPSSSTYSIRYVLFLISPINLGERIAKLPHIVVKGTDHNRWLLRNRWALKKQSLLFDLFNAFDCIESSHKSEFSSPKRPIFLHACVTWSDRTY